ncbi:unnamed protein product [Nezara viridula]|uniref:Uncharacterized protein n=1 Tax=Nezara viridula TaxID=85310 RepID=A0A9P0E9F0_NEZVI|nr:unnamed protein product [Nezara viridula]
MTKADAVVVSDLDPSVNIRRCSDQDGESALSDPLIMNPSELVPKFLENF